VLSFQLTALALLAAEKEYPAAVPDVLPNNPDKLGPAHSHIFAPPQQRLKMHSRTVNDVQSLLQLINL
jgi:hypothetical protein